MIERRVTITSFYLPETGSRADELRIAFEKFKADAQKCGHISDVEIAGPSVDHTGREIPDYYDITGVLTNPHNS